MRLILGEQLVNGADLIDSLEGRQLTESVTIRSGGSA